MLNPKAVCVMNINKRSGLFQFFASRFVGAALVIAAWLFAGFAIPSVVRAQATPSSDVLGAGERYAEASVWTGVQSHANGGSQVYAARISAGVRRGWEIGVNASGSDPNDPEFPIEVQPNVKWQFYQNETRGVTAAGSFTMFVPLVKREGADTFGMVQVAVGKQLGKRRLSPQVTTGAYTLVGRDRGFGTKHGAILQYDQPLARRADFSVQWYTGANRFGYVTPGVTFNLPRSQTVFAGYTFGNTGRANHGAYVSYGRSF